MSMLCKEFSERLDELLEGRLSVDEAAAVEEHINCCAGCRDLYFLAGEEPGVFDVTPPPDLTGAILERTSGSICDSAQPKLCAHVDGELDPVDDELLQLHLGGCGDCEALVAVLERLPQDLPLLAEVEPDPLFVADVLASTLQPASRFKRWIALIGEQGSRLLQRPRLAWEGAYLGTCLLVLIFGIPVSALTGVTTVTQEISQLNPGKLIEPMDRLESQVANGADLAWEKTSGVVVGAWQNATGEITEYSETTIEKVKQVSGTFVRKLASEQETQTTDPPPVSEDPKQGEE